MLFVDDNEMDTMEFTLDAAEWKALPGTVLPPATVTNGTTSNNDKLDNVPRPVTQATLLCGLPCCLSAAVQPLAQRL